MLVRNQFLTDHVGKCFWVIVFTSRAAADSNSGVVWHGSDDCLIRLLWLHCCHVFWDKKLTWDNLDNFIHIFALLL